MGMMGRAGKLATAVALGLVLAAPAAGQQATGQPEQGMLVVYGPAAPSREGDTDWREQVFFSVPADLADRLYIRLFDPETRGEGDFVYGGTADSETTFRLFGGKGAYTDADRPEPAENGQRGVGLKPQQPVTGPGKLLTEKVYGDDPASDGRWVNLTAATARQGEVIDGRAWFRIDVQGSAGNDGNGYSLGVSLARDRMRPPAGLTMFSYRPTVRWHRGDPPTQVRFTRASDGPLVIQSFDAAGGQLALVTDFRDLGVRVSGQDHWTSDVVATEETNLALNLLDGFEIPNDVTLAVFDGNGDPVPLSMPPLRAPVPQRPTARGTVQPLADCRSVAFDASPSSGRIPLSFHWDFGDGTSADLPVIAHRYDLPGRYTAGLSVMEPGDRPGRGDRIELPVHVRDAPISDPGRDITIAPGQAVGFDGSASRASDSPIVRYRWSFGDGATATGARAEHTYAAPGQYRAVLRVEDDSGHPCHFGIGLRRVTVNAPPLAEAGPDLSAMVGQRLQFDGTASYDVDGVITDWRWDMGDGTVLDGASVVYGYPKSGRYAVTLTVTDDSGVANSHARDHATVTVNAPPEPRFTIPLRPVSVSELAVLDASGSTDDDGQILTWIWDFGDGVIGEGPVASYAWTRPGTYQVTLSVSDDSGTTSAVQSLTRTVRVDAAPLADAGPDQLVTASEVVFDGSRSSDSDGAITAWEWDFGDGSTGSGQSPYHAYASPGTYEVALVVRDDSGAPLNTDRATMVLRVNAAPIADAGPPQTVAPGEEFTVSGGASVDPDGHVARYLWEFPGGRRVEGERVADAIADPGLYRIRLTVQDDFPGPAGEDEAEVLITVNAAPVAVAGPDRLIAPGDTVLFDAGQSFDRDGQLTSWRWEFDDLGLPLDARSVERAYDTPGVWTAQLIVTDDSGVLNATASDDVTIRVNAAPTAKAGPVIETESLFVEFDGTGSGDADGDALILTWDFGDGSAPAQGARPTHVFPRPGIYPVTLRVDDGTGLANARSIDATAVTIRSRPLAVAGGNRDVCSGQPILFDASASADPDGGLLQYAWDFGDGSGSDLINPTKTYERPGVYPVTLLVRNETSSQYGSATDRIAALVREGPIADAGGDRLVCSNQRVRFDGTGSTDADGAVNAFAWTFGDGNSGSGETPTHVFTRPGTYEVTLTITGDATGDCSPLDADTARITVVAAPELAVSGPDRAAAGVATAWAAGLSALGDARPGALRWDMGDGTMIDGAEVNHSYGEPGEYLITLSVDLIGGTEGCTMLQAVRKVIVNAAPEPFIEGPTVASVGEVVAFDAGMSADSDGAITGFAWDFGDGNGAATVLAAHRFEAPGTYDLRLAVTDDAGVANSAASALRQIRVEARPEVAASGPLASCPAEPDRWAVAAPDGASVRWQFGDGAEASGAAVSHGFARPGLYPVQVAIDTGAGLKASRVSHAFAARVNAAPLAEAGPDRVVCPGDTVRFDGGASADADGTLTDWEWTFSDGVVLRGQSVERRFDTAADLRVRLVVRDDSGAAACDSGTDAARVLVNAPPVVDAGPDLTVPVGAAHDVVRLDAGDAVDPDGHGLRFGWDFGDGSGAAGAVVRHRYNAPGQYTVTLRAQDQTGLACGVATDTTTVTAVARK
jgi:PKD repeat protein